MNSIIQDKEVCYLCGRALKSGLDRLEVHHIFGGNPNRKHSEEYGLKVFLCGESCHRNGTMSVHRNRKIDLVVKGTAQKKFEEMYSREKFMEVFGKSWL